MSDTALSDSNGTKSPVKLRKSRTASSMSLEQLAAHNNKYRLIMKDRRDCIKEMKAIRFVGSIPDYKRYKVSLAAK